jgi:hypothetical protein
MGVGWVPIPRVKRGQGMTLTTHPSPSSAEVKLSMMSYISSPSWHLHGSSGTALLFLAIVRDCDEINSNGTQNSREYLYLIYCIIFCVSFI